MWSQGDVEAVLFYDVDRFARDPVWIEMVTQKCFHFGVQVAFVRGRDDLSRDTPEARVLRMLKGYAAKPSSRERRNRVWSQASASIHVVRCSVRWHWIG